MEDIKNQLKLDPKNNLAVTSVVLIRVVPGLDCRATHRCLFEQRKVVRRKSEWILSREHVIIQVAGNTTRNPLCDGIFWVIDSWM